MLCVILAFTISVKFQRGFVLSLGILFSFKNSLIRMWNEHHCHSSHLCLNVIYYKNADFVPSLFRMHTQVAWGRFGRIRFCKPCKHSYKYNQRQSQEGQQAVCFLKVFLMHVQSWGCRWQKHFSHLFSMAYKWVFIRNNLFSLPCVLNNSLLIQVLIKKVHSFCFEGSKK
jgi:hypothetical protein